MAEERGDLPHLHGLPSGGAEAEGLEQCGCGDERVVVPESDGVGDRGVALGEEVLELVDLEQIRDRLVAAEDAVLALPPLVARLRLRIGDAAEAHSNDESSNRCCCPEILPHFLNNNVRFLILVSFLMGKRERELL